MARARVVKFLREKSPVLVARTQVLVDIPVRGKRGEAVDEREQGEAPGAVVAAVLAVEAAPDLLQAAAQMGRVDYRRCVVFNSLSKRSNVPGLRSGFVAGDERIIQRFLLYRTYHGCTMPPHTQAASMAAWQDEKHVVENRDRYREKFDADPAKYEDHTWYASSLLIIGDIETAP